MAKSDALPIEEMTEKVEADKPKAKRTARKTASISQESLENALRDQNEFLAAILDQLVEIRQSLPHREEQPIVHKKDDSVDIDFADIADMSHQQSTPTVEGKHNKRNEPSTISRTFSSLRNASAAPIT